MEKRIIGIKTTQVAIAKIGIDDQYQRGRKDAHVNGIEQGFDPLQFTPPTCVMRKNGSIFAVDGQQRLHAAKSLGYTHVWVVLLTDLSPEREAYLYDRSNANSVAVNQQERHKAKLAYREPIALRLEAALARRGLTGKPHGTQEVRALAALRACWPAPDSSAVKDEDVLDAGEERLNFVLDILCAVLHGGGAGHLPREIIQADLINALRWLHKEAPEPLDVEAIMGRLEDVAPAYLRQIVTGHASRSTGGSLTERYGRRLGRWLGFAWADDEAPDVAA